MISMKDMERLKQLECLVALQSSELFEKELALSKKQLELEEKECVIQKQDVEIAEKDITIKEKSTCIYFLQEMFLCSLVPAFLLVWVQSFDCTFYRILLH